MGHRLRSDSGARPKFHYALHLQEQIHRWRRHIDCFAGERKHRVFKSIVAPRLTRLNCFNRSTLLQMTELTTSHLESEYTGQLIGKPTQDVVLTMELGISPESFFAKGIQIYCYVLHRNLSWSVKCTWLLCRGAKIAILSCKESLSNGSAYLAQRQSLQLLL